MRLRCGRGHGQRGRGRVQLFQEDVQTSVVVASVNRHRARRVLRRRRGKVVAAGMFELLMTTVPLLDVGSEIALCSKEAYGSKLGSDARGNREGACRDVGRVVSIGKLVKIFKSRRRMRVTVGFGIWCFMMDDKQLVLRSRVGGGLLIDGRAALVCYIRVVRGIALVFYQIHTPWRSKPEVVRRGICSELGAF